jgi:hypothetical protein
VVAATHQAQFDLILYVFDVEGAAPRPGTHEGAHHGLRELIHHLAHTGRSGPLRAMHRQEGLHHCHGDFGRLEWHHGAVAPDDLVARQIGRCSGQAGGGGKREGGA